MAQSPTTLAERTRLSADPLRNFKFQVEIFHIDDDLSKGLAKTGFTSVDGLNMSTEMLPYREGGWNTNPHKMPGMTDFSPVTLSSGVFWQKPGMWNLAKQMFAVQWGNGNIAKNSDYRFDMMIRVFDHPVTKGEGAAVKGDTGGAVLAFQLYNAWIANVAFSGLNAMDNAILVSQMTVHHEGLDVFWGSGEVTNGVSTEAISNIPYAL